MTHPPTLTIRLLGSFQITHPDGTNQPIEQARLQELLAYLILNRHQPIPRQTLAYLFWPDSTDAQARTNIRNLWYRLRRSLPNPDSYLTTTELTVQWQAESPFWLDVAAFEDHLNSANTANHPDAQIEHLEQAIAIYSGELLPGCYADWLLIERERLQQAYLHARTTLINAYEARRDYPAAIAHARARLRHDPLHESTYAQLMRLHALNDDRAAALHTYHTCATTLRRELDVEPSPATTEIYQRLLENPTIPQPPPQSQRNIPLLGRTSIWEQLLQTWRQSATNPQITLISGDPGIGKSRLAESFAEWLTRQGIPALTARCYATESELAYAPIVAWLRSQTLPNLPDHWLRELARLLPEIQTSHPHLTAPEPLAENWQRLRLFEAITHALLARQSALLLFIDDLQWADPDTLDWLQYLLANPLPTTQTQLLVLATQRSSETDNLPRLTAWQTTLARTERLTVYPLTALSPAATVQLANYVAQQPLTDHQTDQLYQESEGNPLFIIEMVRAGVPSTVADTDTDPPISLPTRVRQVLEAHLAQLSAPARAVIDLAAVIGRDFTYPTLALATDHPEATLVTCLDECWQKGIIREQGHDAYDFTHDKLREVAYTSLSRTRRRWLHGQVAKALTAAENTNHPANAAIIAAHFQAAQQPEPALRYYHQAAQHAHKIYAHSEALTALKNALDLIPSLPETTENQATHAQLLEMQADIWLLLAQYDNARAAYQTALTLTPATHRLQLVELNRKIGKSMIRERVEFETVAAQYQLAEDLLGPPTPTASPEWWQVWCEVQLEQLFILYWWNRPQAMAARLAQVSDDIEAHGTPLQRAAYFNRRSHQANRTNRFAPSDEALNFTRAAVAALPADINPHTLAEYQFGLAFNLLWHGDFQESLDLNLTALAAAQQTGDLTLQTRCLAYIVIAYRRLNQPDQAEPYIDQLHTLATGLDLKDYVGAAFASRAWLAYQRADLAAAEQLARQALTTWEHYGLPYPLRWQAFWPLIAITLADDRLDQAIAFAKQLNHPDQQAIPPAIWQPLTTALTAWQENQPESARPHLQQALNLAQSHNIF